MGKQCPFCKRVIDDADLHAQPSPPPSPPPVTARERAVRHPAPQKITDVDYRTRRAILAWGAISDALSVLSSMENDELWLVVAELRADAARYEADSSNEGDPRSRDAAVLSAIADYAESRILEF